MQQIQPDLVVSYGLIDGRTYKRRGAAFHYHIKGGSGEGGARVAWGNTDR